MPNTKSKNVFMECKCPKCGCVYKKRMNWQGIGMPRIYCDSCTGKVNPYTGGVHQYASNVFQNK